MLLFKQAIAILISLLLLSACQTLAPAEITAKTQAQIDRIQIGKASDRKSQIFLRQLEDNLNQNNALRDLSLATKLAESSGSTLSVKGKSSTLSKTTMTVSYSLTDRVSGEIITEGELKATATSGTVSSYYGQAQSRKFISERLSRTLSDRLAQTLRLHFLVQDKE